MALPVPAMAPLHDGPPRPIVDGETWTKRASQRNSDKRPIAFVLWFKRGRVHYQTGAKFT